MDCEVIVLKYRRYDKVNGNIRHSRNERLGYNLRPRQEWKDYLLIIFMLLIVLFITRYELQVLLSEHLIQKMITQELDYESIRMMQINEDILDKTEARTEEFLKKNPELKNVPYVDKTGYLTFCMMANSYHLTKNRLVDLRTFRRGIIRLAKTSNFQKLYGYYKAILENLKFFPVPRVSDQSADISYVDSWYQPRTYGGKRKHEGTDLMASNNKRGFFPVISITDGTVEQMGWLEQGGYRIGIRSRDGGYFYYAHLSTYAPELKQGNAVIAGQLLGFMGDSGYGKEGTVGQFDVHLHLGIYVNADDKEMSVNPYWILKLLEKNRTIYKNVQKVK